MAIIAFFLGGLILLFVLGFGAPYAIGIVSAIGLLAQRGWENFPFSIVAQKIVYSGNNFVLMAIPFFLLAGKLMNTGSITNRIFNFCNTMVGWIPGGLGHANVLASVVFAGMSGSAVADAAGLGTIEIRAMEDQGFDTDFSAAVTAASSTIGPIIPPSIALIMFGVTAGNVNIAKLLISGIVPGLIMAVALSIMIYWFAIKRNYPCTKFPTLTHMWLDFKPAFFPLLTPLILIGGMLLGIFTPTEAAAVSSIYAFFLTVVCYRELSLRAVVNVLLETCKESAAIMFIVCASALYGYLIVRMQVPTKLMNLMFAFTTNKYLILLLINILLLVVGCFMEANAAIVILTPTLVAMTNKLGIDPIHLGMVMVLNLMIGLLTPPVGMCLFTVSRVAGISLDRMIRATAPFYIPLIASLLIITYFPQTVLWLPNALL